MSQDGSDGRDGQEEEGLGTHNHDEQEEERANIESDSQHETGEASGSNTWAE